MPSSFREKRCLVTGGTGFIGGRLVESLAAEGAEVRVLARNLSKAPRIGRWPVRLIRGDVAVGPEVEAAIRGCDHVFHCAVGLSGDENADRAVTVGGTEHVIRACAEHGARLVHVSTVSVYGPTPDGPLTEEAERRPGGDFYGVTKLQAEDAVLEAARAGKLAASVVQPTVVYGPFGPAWTLRTFSELESGRVMLIDGGEGLCNVVYIDDIVQGLRLAATEEGALGEAFLISGPRPVTWREFYGAHERLLGYESHVERSAEEAHELFERLYGRRRLLRESISVVRDHPDLRRRLKATPEVQAFLRAAKVLVPPKARKAIQNRLRGVKPAPAPEPTEQEAEREDAATTDGTPKPVLPMGPAGIEMARSKTHARIDKARQRLGYAPAFDFDAGMARVAEWARWYGLLPDPGAGVGHNGG